MALVFLSRLQRTVAQVGKTVRPSLFVDNNGAVAAGPDFRGLPKAKAAEKHMELLDGLPRSSLLVYSDGSQDELGNTGWGAVTFHDCETTTACGYLPNAEVYDAEAVGAYEGMKLTRTRVMANPDIKEVLLFLDNSSVVDGILGTTPASSQRAYMGLRNIAQKLLPGVTTRVAWVPGHKDVLGNETAGKLARRVQNSQDQRATAPPSLTSDDGREDEGGTNKRNTGTTTSPPTTSAGGSKPRPCPQNSTSHALSSAGFWRRGQDTETSWSTTKDSSTTAGPPANAVSQGHKGTSWSAAWWHLSF
ncbi:hypothetical protein V8C42DRAFT_363610 [Trichoderma barbatum]